MGRTVFRLLAAASLGLGLGAAPAAAIGGSTYAGECGFSFDISGQIGAVDARVVVYSNTAAHNPVSADVTCSLAINGSPVLSETYSGTVVVTGSAVVPLDVTEDDVITVCTVVDYTSNPDPSDSDCYDTYVDFVANALVRDLNRLVFERLDPALCTVLAALRPGVPPQVYIDEQGDVYLGGQLFWDCPPYEV